MWVSGLVLVFAFHGDSLQKMEHEEGEVRSDVQKLMRMTHYDFINYKQFVNVVKYKLDHMRRKLEMEEKKVTA